MGRFLAVDQFAGPAAAITALLALILSAARLGFAGNRDSQGRTALMSLIALTSILAAGCGSGQQTQGGPQQSSTNDATSAARQTAFERCLSTWSAGDEVGALRDFLAMNMRDANLFSEEAGLAMSEAQFVALPQAAREKLSQPMLDDLTKIKALCRAVKELAEKSRAKGDAAHAAKCVGQIKQLGERLDQPTVVVIGQKVGQALKKMAAEYQRTTPSR